MKRAAIYARVSSTMQAEEGVSIPAQIKLLHQYALENRFEVTHEFVDRGESARSADRPEFQNMIARAKKREFDVILVHKTDRFARNREDSIIYKSLLRRECGVEVISITEKFEDSPTGRMMEGIMEVVAEFYSANLAKEVMKGMNEKASSGQALGEPPYGYSIDEESGKFVIYEPEAKLVRYIFERYIAGDGLRTIGMDIRANGVNMFGKTALLKESKAVKASGKHKDRNMIWQPNTVRSVLTRLSYTGDYVWNDTIIKNNHPSIISRQDFELVQDLLEMRKKKRRQTQDYLLRGLVTCMECGGTMSQLNQRYTTVAGDNRVYTALRCTKHVRLGVCYPNISRMHEVEELFVAFLDDIANNNVDIRHVAIKKTKDDDMIEEYNRLLKKYQGIDAQFDRQMEAFQAGIIDLEQLKTYKNRLESEKSQLEQNLEVLKRKIDSDETDVEKFKNDICLLISNINSDDLTMDQKRNQLIKHIDEIQLSAKKDEMKVVFKA